MGAALQGGGGGGGQGQPPATQPPSTQPPSSTSPPGEYSVQSGNSDQENYPLDLFVSGLETSLPSLNGTSTALFRGQRIIGRNNYKGVETLLIEEIGKPIGCSGKNCSFDLAKQARGLSTKPTQYGRWSVCQPSGNGSGRLQCHAVTEKMIHSLRAMLVLTAAATKDKALARPDAELAFRSLNKSDFGSGVAPGRGAKPNTIYIQQSNRELYNPKSISICQPGGCITVITDAAGQVDQIFNPLTQEWEKLNPQAKPEGKPEEQKPPTPPNECIPVPNTQSGSSSAGGSGGGAGGQGLQQLTQIGQLILGILQQAGQGGNQQPPATEPASAAAPTIDSETNSLNSENSENEGSQQIVDCRCVLGSVSCSTPAGQLAFPEVGCPGDAAIDSSSLSRQKQLRMPGEASNGERF